MSQSNDSGAAAQKDDIEEAIMYAKRYVEDLLSFFGLNTDVYATTEDHEVIELDIPSTHLNGFLIGQHGETLRALQFTVSTALKNQNYGHNRVNADVAGYKKQHADRVAKQAEAWFAEVRESGEPKELQPMSAADRRVIHKVAEEWGLTTESIGEGRERHIVIKPVETEVTGEVDKPKPKKRTSKKTDKQSPADK
ncbi:MAG TPA: R3H domain-containing nucleic acid-binding protein [Candidatus Saccharimonadales bacterium]|nr:R3H domain-containing nucleic acid-binding protein [Candidatus Saccharimonadales bacterium]